MEALHVAGKFQASWSGYDTVGEHREVIARLGNVWWGDWSNRPISQQRSAQLKDQIARGISTFLFLRKTKSQEWSKGRLIGLDGRSAKSDTNVPDYYKGKECAAWFLIDSLQRASNAEIDNLVLDSNNEPLTRFVDTTTPLFYVRMVVATKEAITQQRVQPTPPSTAPSVAKPTIKSPQAATRRVFGPPLNFRELRHEPTDEQGVVYLFGMVAWELGFLVEGVRKRFPDCAAKRRMPDGLYELVDIEFEFKASNFQQHGHDPSGCDLIVCWQNDWPDSPLEVLELKSAIKQLNPNA